ncbi:uncharacterized protein JCM6883_004480 [Sporobolomyces salmoneus]|uniref:uncharacterized protein n=1 Tax=Sporobolomyces salmoneus TaxID=183962 RepID=UPI0031799204
MAHSTRSNSADPPIGKSSSNIDDLPPFAFSFTFYAPLGASPVQYFNSDEPPLRTSVSIIKLDEEVWNVSKGSGNKGASRVVTDSLGVLDTDVGSGKHAQARLSDLPDDGKNGVTGVKRKPEVDATNDKDGETPHSKRTRLKGSPFLSMLHDSKLPVPLNPQFTNSPLPPPSTFPFESARTLRISLGELMQSLTISDFAPFLSTTPVPASISDEYALTLLRFFAFVEDPTRWIEPEFRSIYAPRNFSNLSSRVRQFFPDFERIRKEHPLGQLANDDNDESIAGNRALAYKTVDWIWGEKTYSRHLRFVVKRSPLPLFALVLEFVTVQRYLEAVRHTLVQFRLFLSTPTSGLSPRALRAKALDSRKK